MPTYEAMFLMNPAVAPEWSAAEAEIRRILDRGQAKILAMKKWDERKLAYEIEGHKRGAYGLVFFEANGEVIGPMERDAQISEAVLRLLILRHERMSQEEIDKIMAAAAPPKHLERGPESFDRDHRGDRGPRPAPERERPPERAVEEPAAAEEELEGAPVK